MKYGTTKSGKIHLFSDSNECLCDINIQIDKSVSKEYASIKNICIHCLHILSNHSLEVKND